MTMTIAIIITAMASSTISFLLLAILTSSRIAEIEAGMYWQEQGEIVELKRKLLDSQKEANNLRLELISAEMHGTD